MLHWMHAEPRPWIWVVRFVMSNTTSKKARRKGEEKRRREEKKRREEKNEKNEKERVAW